MTGSRSRAACGAVLAKLGTALVLFGALAFPATAAEPAKSREVAAAKAAPEAAVSAPTGKGLPVVVRAAVYFHNIESFDDNKGVFEATTDLRLTWHDLRLRYPAREALHGYKEYRVSAAEEMMAKIWSPRLRIVNKASDPTFTERRLRIYPDGKVETITRSTMSYKTPIDVTRFPFDLQPMLVEFVVNEDTIEVVDLDFVSEDVEFSRVARNVEVSGWTPGLVNLKRDLLKGWNGDRYARMKVTVDMQRQAGSTIAPIFIPLFASLLIPFLSVWMNKAIAGEFEVEAFELANVVIGGLFAVIALGFTISSAYPAIVAGDNTVTRLIGLNYVALAFGAVVAVVFYRYRMLANAFGPYVQEQIFRFISWSFPLTFVLCGLGFVAMSAA
jgi:hypothetical protein